MQKSCFISFEGGEGAGKSTQIQALAQRLEQAGKKVLCLREPGGTALGESLRKLIKFPPGPVCAEAELALFIAARAQLVREVIQPALNMGTIVLCDRFLDSTVVYQGLSRGLNIEAVHALNDFAVGKTRPTLTFFLDLPAELGLKRAQKRNETADRLEQEPLTFHKKVREGYHALLKLEPARFMAIDAQLPINTIEKQIWSTVSHFLES